MTHTWNQELAKLAIRAVLAAEKESISFTLSEINKQLSKNYHGKTIIACIDRVITARGLQVKLICKYINKQIYVIKIPQQ